MANRKRNETTADEQTIEQRAADYCRTGENAAHYLAGLADAIELMNGGLERMNAFGVVRRLRSHAHELQFGTMWVEHGFKEPKE